MSNEAFVNKILYSLFLIRCLFELIKNFLKLSYSLLYTHLLLNVLDLLMDKIFIFIFQLNYIHSKV